MHNNSIVGSKPEKLFITFNFRITSARLVAPTLAIRPDEPTHTLGTPRETRRGTLGTARETRRAFYGFWCHLGIAAATAEDRILEDYDDVARWHGPAYARTKKYVPATIARTRE
jgi:hypothetical protein